MRSITEQTICDTGQFRAALANKQTHFKEELKV